MKIRIVAAVIAVLLIAAAHIASAATITVNTTADNLTGGDGQCTLREAIANVNAAADTTGGDCAAGTGTGDTVTFDFPLPAMITLALGELVVERDVSIVGPTAGALRISGGRKSRIFTFTTGTTASVSDLTMQHGRTDPRLDPFGGAILNLGGTLTLRRCTLAKNTAGSGGAIANGIGGVAGGTATLIDCTLEHNRARGGGAIRNFGTMTLSNCTLTRNVAAWRAGVGTGGGINNHGTMTLTNCTLDRNRAAQAGGIYNGIAGAGTITLTNCTLTRNYARWGAGGAIQNLGALTLTNCTISRNKTWMGRHSLGGGGLWQYPADQDPNGVGGTAIVTNTIIAGNGKAHDCGGNRPISGGHNLDGDGNCFTAGGTDLVNTDPLLVPLGDYGGPTPTLALCTGAVVPDLACLAASPAIDAGDDAVTGPPLNLTTDQRGLPRLSGAHADIGAYEAQQ